MTIKKNGARNNAVGRAKPAQASHNPTRNQRCRVNASRVASSAKNTTTTCAVNQYVPSAARYQNGVPSAKSSVIQRRDDSEITMLTSLRVPVGREAISCLGMELA